METCPVWLSLVGVEADAEGGRSRVCVCNDQHAADPEQISWSLRRRISRRESILFTQFIIASSPDRNRFKHRDIAKVPCVECPIQDKHSADCIESQKYCFESSSVFLIAPD